MCDTWLGFSSPDMREGLRRALAALDEKGTLRFADTEAELRELVTGASADVGVLVGAWEGDLAVLDIVGALTSEGNASRVVLVALLPTDRFAKLAREAGADDVIDVFTLPGPEPDHAWMRLPAIDGGRDDESRGESTSNELMTYEAAAFPCVTGDVPRDAYDGIRVAKRREDHGENLYLPEARVIMSGPRTDQAPVLAFVSGRGGVGKTTLVAVMAAMAASWGMRVSVLDLDLSCGNLYSCFGLPGPADLGRLARDACPSADDVLGCGVEATEGVTLWGSCERPEMGEAVAPHAGFVISTLAAASDLVLVDASTTFTDAVAQAAQQCDRLLMVVDGLPGSGVAQARLAALAVRLGVPRTRIVRLANRCGHRGRSEPLINRADVGLETARPISVQDGGVEVRDFLAEGNVGDLLVLGSRFTDSAGTALAKLLVELGRLPNTSEARHALEQRRGRGLWGWKRRREAM